MCFSAFFWVILMEIFWGREGEEGLGVVRNDHHPLFEIIFTVGG